MIQNWMQTIETPNGSPAQRKLRCSLRVSLRANFDSAIYQPKSGGLDRAAEIEI